MKAMKDGRSPKILDTKCS